MVSHTYDTINEEKNKKSSKLAYIMEVILKSGYIDDDETLLALALTSKEVSESALDLVWHKMSSLLPILKLLPALKKSSGFYVLSGQTTNDHLQYFYKFSRRVKEFECPSSKVIPNIPHLTYLRLAQVANLVFPCLQRLSFPIIRDKMLLDHIFLFLSPSLRSVDIKNIQTEEDHIVYSFIETLVWEAPSLERLILGGSVNSTSTVHHLIPQFRGLKELSLVLPDGSDEIFILEAIGGLPFLTSLTITGADREYKFPDNNPQPNSRSVHSETFQPCYSEEVVEVDCLQDTLEQNSTPGIATEMSSPLQLEDNPGSLNVFNTLKNLRISGQISFIDGLLRRIASVDLERIDILVLCEPEDLGMHLNIQIVESKGYRKPQRTTSVEIIRPSRLETCFENMLALVASHWSKSMRSITISCQQNKHHERYDTQFQVLDMQRLTLHLGALQNMEIFCVDQWNLASLDECLKELALSWPKLRVMRVPVGTFGSPITLDALRVLSESCQRLDTLQCSLNLNPLPGLPTFANYASSHKLHTLSTGHNNELSTTKSLTVARHLNILFPFLEEIETHMGENPDNWELIHTMLQTFQAVRQDDRNRKSSK